MAKVLLAIEKYPELVYIETLLKKVGFDCQGCQNDMSVPELLLTFMPELIIANATGKKVHGVKLAGRLKRYQDPPQVLLLSPDPSSITDQERRENDIASVVSSPIDPETFIQAVANLLGMEFEDLLKKFSRGFAAEEKEEALTVREKNHGKGHETIEGHGDDGPSGHHLKQDGTSAAEKVKKQDFDRANRYLKALSELPSPEHTGLNRERVSDQVSDFRLAESDPEIQDIDKERIAFTKALFKKNKPKT